MAQALRATTSLDSAVVTETARLDLEETLDRLVERNELELPAYPAVAFRLLKTIQSDRFVFQQLTDLLSSDQALSATIMRCANSAMFGGRTKATTLNAAIGRIGTEELIRLAMASALAAQATSAGSLATIRRAVFRNALASALLCRTLAARRGLPADEAFLCGLLHDFGKVVVLSTLEKILEQHPASAAKPLAFWADVVERDHVDVGAKMAHLWNLPDVVCEVIRHHHEPMIGTQAQALVELVSVADEVVQLLNTEPHVGAEVLSKLQRVRESEREELARTIPELPGILDALETGKTRERVIPSKVEDPASSLNDVFPVDFPVSPYGTEPEETFRAVAISSNGFAMVSRQALPVNFLAHLQLEHDEEGLEIWATVHRCQRVGTEYRMELRPYALRGETLRRWVEITTRARAAMQA